MKKLFSLLALIFVCAAILILTTVHGQNSNAGKFRRADKRIPNHYIVVLKDNVADVDSEATKLSQDYSGDCGNEHTYGRALKAFSVRMSEPQATRYVIDLGEPL